MPLNIQGIGEKVQPSVRTGIKRSFHALGLTLGILLPLNYAIQKNNVQRDIYQPESAVVESKTEKDMKNSKTLGLIGLSLLAASVGSMRHDDIESRIGSNKD